MAAHPAGNRDVFLICRYDTDGDGNCPWHPHGCADAFLEGIADDLADPPDNDSPGEASDGR